LLFLILLFFLEIPSLSFTLISTVLITAFLSVIGYLSFYKGLQVGKVSVISPVAACWAAITVVLSLVFLGESLTTSQVLGVGLAVGGAVLVSFRLKDLVGLKIRNILTGVEYAVVAMLAWGISFTLIDVIVGGLGWFLTMFLLKLVLILYLLVYSFVTKKDIVFPQNIVGFIVLIGIFEAIASLAYGLGITSEFTSIVAPISAAFPMVTVILAGIFLKERLEINQKIGIFSILSGLVLLSL